MIGFKQTAILVVCVAVLVGCAGSDLSLRMMERDGTLRVDTSDDKSYDYKVFIESRFDFGWDGNIKEDRLKTVKLLFKDSCPNVKVIDEKPINKGTLITGRPVITWVMKVKCER